MSDSRSTPARGLFVSARPAPGPSASKHALAWMLVVGAVGLVAAYHQGFFSGFAWIPIGPNDGVLNLVFLEQSWQWVRGSPAGRDLWTAPFFFPCRNTMALSDLMASFGPPYWVFRLAGFDPPASGAGWVLVMSAANYLLAWRLFHRYARFSPPASSFGAFLLAFAAVRAGNTAHLQLLPAGYLLGAFLCVCAYARGLEHGGSAWRRRAVLAMGGLLLALQFYGGFYLGIFIIVGILVGTPAAMLFADGRRLLFASIRKDGRALPVIGALVFLALVPAASHYIETVEEVGPRHLETQSNQALSPLSLFTPSDRSFLYYGVSRAFGSSAFSDRDALNPGWLASLAAAIGLWVRRKNRALQFVTLVCVLVGAMGVSFGGVVAWQWLYHAVPGASAIRATFRLGLAFLIPTALGWAALADWLTGLRRPGRVLFGTLLTLACAEQITWANCTMTASLRARLDTIEQRIEPSREPFLAVVKKPIGTLAFLEEDAMLVAVSRGVPTVSGRSGNYPPGYPFERAHVAATVENADEARTLLTSWMAYCRYRGPCRLIVFDSLPPLVASRPKTRRRPPAAFTSRDPSTSPPVAGPPS